MPKSGIEPRSSDQKRISLSIRPRGSWLLSDKLTLILAHVLHIFVYHLDRTAYKRCHFIGRGSPLGIRTSCCRWPSDWSNEVVIYSCYRGQTRSGSHGMEGVEDGLKYRGLRRCVRGPGATIHLIWKGGGLSNSVWTDNLFSAWARSRNLYSRGMGSGKFIFV